MNIFPLSSLVNQFRDIRIPRKTQFIMWFSGTFELETFRINTRHTLPCMSEKSTVNNISFLLMICFTCNLLQSKLSLYIFVGFFLSLHWCFSTLENYYIEVSCHFKVSRKVCG